MVTTNDINNTVGASDDGLTNTFTVQNTSDTASSQAKQLITVGGTSAGDAWTQWSVGSTTSFAMGIDNSDSDYLKLTYAASGTATPSDANPLITIDPVLGRFSFDKSTDNTIAYYLNNLSNTSNAQSTYIVNQELDTGTGALVMGVINQGNPVTRVQRRSLIQTTGTDGLTLDSINTGGTSTFEFWSGPIAAPYQISATTSGGLWTWPRQSQFLAYLASTATNKTGNGTAYTLGTDALTEVFDTAGNFNTNGTFTAPVAGLYDLRAQVTVTGNTIATTFVIALVTTTQTFQYTFTKVAGAEDESVSISALAYMSATDTATVTITVSGEAADTSDIKGGATRETYFCGTLLH